MPRYGVFETVVTPKQLAVNNKGWRAKDVQLPRLVGVVIISATDRFRVGCDNYAIGILANLAQTFREIGFFSGYGAGTLSGNSYLDARRSTSRHM